MTMQPDEMKAIREALGMTQQAFAEALGMSRKSINEMERGGKIERRTELACRYLADHPDEAPRLAAEAPQVPEGSFLSRLWEFLKAEPETYEGAGSLSTYSVESSAGQPIVVTVRCRRA